MTHRQSGQKIAFRADASLEIGSGHVMRCLALADALRERGAEILFVCREHPGHLCDFAEARGYAVARLPPPVRPIGEGYARWLGATWETDAAETLFALRQWTPEVLRWLVVDHYALDARWERRVREAPHRLMAIDDLADREHDCDILLDQNYYSDAASRYDHLIPAGCRRLLGPRYALLRREFSHARRELRPRDGTIRRLLLTFGGADPTNATGQALEALQSFAEADLDILVITGSSSPHRNDLLARYSTSPHIRFIHNANNMAELFAAADLVVGAGGGTLWERCCLGLPSITLSIAANQSPVCIDVARAGAHLYLGEARTVKAEQICNAVALLQQMPQLAAHLGECARQLCDGRGAERVARRLAPLEIALRAATESDCDALWRWRNNDATRAFSGDAAPIALETHRTWYRFTLANPARALLIGQWDSEPVGVIRYDFSGAEAAVSLYLVPGTHGQGRGRDLLEAGIAWLRQQRPEISRIVAHVKPGNEKSLALFADTGFTADHYVYTKALQASP